MMLHYLLSSGFVNMFWDGISRYIFKFPTVAVVFTILYMYKIMFFFYYSLYFVLLHPILYYLFIFRFLSSSLFVYFILHSVSRIPKQECGIFFFMQTF